MSYRNIENSLNNNRGKCIRKEAKQTRGKSETNEQSSTGGNHKYMYTKKFMKHQTARRNI